MQPLKVSGLFAERWCIKGVIYLDFYLFLEKNILSEDTKYVSPVPQFVLHNAKQNLSYLNLNANKMGAKSLCPMYLVHLAMIFEFYGSDDSKQLLIRIYF